MKYPIMCFVLIIIFWVRSSLTLASITEDNFKNAFDRVSLIYKDIAASAGYKLSFRYLSAKEGTVGARINEDLSGEIIGFGSEDYGQLDQDSLTLILCHELGHLIGGMPTMDPYGKSTTEGQADYFASLKCLPKIIRSEYLGREDSLKSIARFEHECSKTHSDVFSINVCTNVIQASFTASVFNNLVQGNQEPIELNSRIINFANIENYFNLGLRHPNSQCRLQTYVAGALCTDDPSLDVDIHSVLGSACKDGNPLSQRPACWYYWPSLSEIKNFSRKWISVKAKKNIKFKFTPSNNNLNFGTVEYSDHRLGKCSGTYDRLAKGFIDDPTISLKVSCDNQNDQIKMYMDVSFKKMTSNENLTIPITIGYIIKGKYKNVKLDFQSFRDEITN